MASRYNQARDPLHCARWCVGAAGLGADFVKAKRSWRVHLRERRIRLLRTGSSGRKVSRNRPPAPQHGVGVSLDQASTAYLWVDGEHDALLLGSLEAITKDEIAAWTSEYHLSVASIRKTAIAGLEARDIEFRGNPGQRVRRLRLIVAFRPEMHGVGILYTIGLRERTPRVVNDAHLTGVIRSFRIIEHDVRTPVHMLRKN